MTPDSAFTERELKLYWCARLWLDGKPSQPPVYKSPRPIEKLLIDAIRNVKQRRVAVAIELIEAAEFAVQARARARMT